MVIDSLPKAKKIYLNKQNKIIDYELIRSLHETEGYDINFMCRELKITRAAYYKWLKKGYSVRDQKNDELLRMILC